MNSFVSNTLKDIVNYQRRILRAGIITCNIDFITKSIGNISHERSLGPITISATSKQHFQAIIRKSFPDTPTNILQSVRSVSKVHHDEITLVRTNKKPPIRRN